MKSIINTIFLALVFTLFSACSSELDPEKDLNTQERLLVGQWDEDTDKPEKLHYNFKSDKEGARFKTDSKNEIISGNGFYWSAYDSKLYLKNMGKTETLTFTVSETKLVIGEGTATTTFIRHKQNG